MYDIRMQPPMNDGLVLVQLLYNNGFNLKAHNSCVFINLLHLKKKKKKEENTLNPFLSFVRTSYFLSKVGLAVSTNSTNYQHKNNMIIVMT